MVKREIKRILALLPAAAVVAVAVMWWAGVFDVSFISRAGSAPPRADSQTAVDSGQNTSDAPTTLGDKTGDDSGGQTSSDTPDSTTDNASGSASGNSSGSSGTTQLETQLPGDSVVGIMRRRPFDTSAYSPRTAEDLRAQGGYFTSAYDPATCELALVRTPFSLTNTLSYREKQTWAIERVTPETGEWYSVYVPATAPRLALEPYMGYIIYDYKGRQTFLLDSQGNTLFEFDPTVYKLANTRDAQNNPLFYTETAEQRADTDGGQYTATRRDYFRVSDDRRSFVPATYDDAAENRGLYFDYPATYGQSDNDLVRLCVSDTVVTTLLSGAITERPSCSFAYGRSRTSLRTGYRYALACNFSEGLAATANDKGELIFIRETGYSAFIASRTYANEASRYVISTILTPQTNGIESLGSFYFERGLCRVRLQIVDYYNKTTRQKTIVMTDEELLINKNGERFPLPAGYALVAYSDGVAMLEKDGKYGFLDYTGAWIAQPVYSVATPFTDGLATVGWSGAVGMIDVNGDVVLPMKYRSISQNSSGVVCAHNDESWELYNVYNKGN